MSGAATPAPAPVEAVFELVDGLYVPSAHARGPWDPNAMHGGPPAGLLAQAVHSQGPQMQIVRATYDFLSAVPLAPVAVELHDLKPGRRLRIVEATLRHEGRAVLTARFGLMRRGDVALPARARAGSVEGGVRGEDPERWPRLPFPVAGAQETFSATGVSIRFPDGSDWSGGPAQAWFRLERELVAGVETAPAARAAVAADFLNGVSRLLPWSGWLFVNSDLTIALWRDPVGDQIRVDARTRIEPTGIGWASGTLHDVDGPIGHAQQSLFVEPR